MDQISKSTGTGRIHRTFLQDKRPSKESSFVGVEERRSAINLHRPSRKCLFRELETWPCQSPPIQSVRQRRRRTRRFWSLYRDLSLPRARNSGKTKNILRTKRSTTKETTSKSIVRRESVEQSEFHVRAHARPASAQPDS